MRGLLGTFLIINMLGHLLCAWVCQFDSIIWVLQTNAFIRSNRAFSVGAHLTCGLFWFIIALIVLIVHHASPPSVDGDGGSGSGSGDGGWGPHGHGLVLGMLWMVDAGVALLLCNVITTRQPLSFFRPLVVADKHADENGDIMVLHQGLSGPEARTLLQSAVFFAGATVCGLGTL